MSESLMFVRLWCESCGDYFGVLDETGAVPAHPFCAACVPLANPDVEPDREGVA